MAGEQNKGAGSPVVLRERYQIFPGTPLPELNAGTAQAFLAKDRRDGERALFALVVRPGYPARLNVMRALKGVECPGLMPLLEWGVTDWPPAGRKVMAVVYETPLGGRIADDLKADFRRIDESDMVRKVVAPVVAALGEMRSHGVTHRAIRPTNMFWATPAKDRVVLGDCCTAPAAFDQPVVVESVENGMTLPSARGNGTAVDDAYAFGASLLMMMIGRNPLRNLDDQQVLRAKMSQGSYGVLVDDQRLPLAIIELLRGLLCDDPEQRWTHEAMDLWLAGRRLTPLLARSEKRASRAFSIGGRDHFFSRDLAQGLASNWEAAKPLLAEGKVTLWVRRSLDQKEKASALEVVVAEAAAAAAERRPSGDLMVAKAAMVLDPLAPLRYKGVSVMPTGFGTLLAVTLVEGGDLRILAEALMRDGPKAWFETRPAYSPDNSILETGFRSVKLYLERGTIGFGMERVLYELNDSMPCISPLTVQDYVTDIRDLLPALNGVAKTFEGKGAPLDRHIAGFIAARANFEVERQINDLADPQPARASMAMLSLFATMQWRLGQTGLQGLGGWLLPFMQPVINSYHSRERRRFLEKEVAKLARDGNLIEMARILDNPDDRMQDIRGFEQARLDWSGAHDEISRIIGGPEESVDPKTLRIGRQIAALISVGVSLATVSLLLVQRLM